MTKPKGIVDPWRTVDPVHPPARIVAPQRERINLEDIDFDADLAIPGRYVIRSTHASFDVVSVRVQAPKDALDVLGDCVADAARVRPIGNALITAGIGVRRGTMSWNPPNADEPTSSLKSEDTTLWFAHTPIDQGMLVLARILRMPEVAATCKRHGVTVMT
jgi:hypothetical protein